MKQFLFAVGVIVAAISSIVGQSQVAFADVNDFIINSFDADYHLGRDSENRSTLRTVEKITATFPVSDQNHGIERAIPEKYDGHSTRLNIESITDESGQEIPYSDEGSSNNNRVLRIGDADSYVHGEKTYIITYTQHDVTRFFADTNDDEFYWDVNGTGWTQQIEKVSARVFIDSSITPALTTKMSCYQGREGANEPCSVMQNEQNGQTILSFASTRSLLGRENISFAIGFTPHTFAEYQPTVAEKVWAFLGMVWLVLFVIGSIVGVAMIVWMSVKRRNIMNRIRGRGTIIPEYLPPKNASVLVSALVTGRRTQAMTAQLLDLAVRHYIKIYQTKEKALFKPAEYELEVTKDLSDLTKEERRLIATLFGDKKAKIGDRFAMKMLQNNYKVGQKLVKDHKQLQDDTHGGYGFYEKAEVEAKMFNKAAVILLIVGFVTLSPVILVAAIIGFVYAHTLWPLTEKGVVLRDYLSGLKLYIDVAETDRIKMLQSPEGVEKVGKVGDSPKQLVKLYEQVLPYAVLFGQEKEWMKQLGAYYEAGSQQPDWYAGNGAFNAVMFTSALNNFSDQSNSYGASTSASSGGSGGGGSSGGGGGGGGGGGW